VQHGAVMARDALEWIKEAMPYWNRNQGRNHIW
jgi:hypothetical protein